MDNRELLELAAKACGLKVSDDYEEQAGFWVPSLIRFWNSITSDADCAWMEAELRINLDWCVEHKVIYCSAEDKEAGAHEFFSDHPSPGHARRMASTRVAAEIQRQKEAQG